MPGEFDMRRMQEEAARRAREMQSRARMPQPRHTQGEGRPSKESPKEPPKAPAEAPPPPEPAPAPQGRPVQAEGANSLLENLFKDKERTIILALLILLGSEEGNQELLLARRFLLMCKTQRRGQICPHSTQPVRGKRSAGVQRAFGPLAGCRGLAPARRRQKARPSKITAPARFPE